MMSDLVLVPVSKITPTANWPASGPLGTLLTETCLLFSYNLRDNNGKVKGKTKSQQVSELLMMLSLLKNEVDTNFGSIPIGILFKTLCKVLKNIEKFCKAEGTSSSNVNLKTLTNTIISIIFACLPYFQAVFYENQQHLLYRFISNIISSLYHLNSNEEPTNGKNSFNNFIIWLNPGSLTHFSGSFQFCKEAKADPGVFVMRQDLHLIHCTPSINFAEMLDVFNSKLTFQGPTDIQRMLTKRKDIAAEGLTYFCANMSDYLREPEFGNKFCRENRYGVVRITIKLSDITFPYMDDGKWRFYLLGTKKYSYEYAQQILATCDSAQINWHLLNHSNRSNAIHKLKEMEVFQPLFEVKCCKPGANKDACACYSWTHPEIVIPGRFNVDLKNVKIEFDPSHDCIVTEDGRRTRCIDCLGGVEAFAADRSKQPNLAEIATNNFAKCSIEKQEKIKAFQKTWKIFGEEQFNQILKCWDITKNRKF